MNKNKLKISKSDILSMHYFGKTNGEIAEIAGVSPGRISQIVNGYYKCDKNITMTEKKQEQKPAKRPRGANKSKSKEKKPVTIMTLFLLRCTDRAKVWQVSLVTLVSTMMKFASVSTQRKAKLTR